MIWQWLSTGGDEGSDLRCVARLGEVYWKFTGVSDAESSAATVLHCTQECLRLRCEQAFTTHRPREGIGRAMEVAKRTVRRAKFGKDEASWCYWWGAPRSHSKRSEGAPLHSRTATDRCQRAPSR
jgi:hypothetical protein